MRIALNIFIFFLLICGFTYGQKQFDNFNILIPKYIPNNSSFDISIIGNKSIPEADRLILHLNPSDNLQINSCRLSSVELNNYYNLPVKKSDKNNNSVRDVIINFTGLTLGDYDYFQILLNLTAGNSNEGSLKISGEFQKDQSTVGYLSETQTYSENIIKFYKPAKSSGNSISFQNQSYLSFDFPETNRDNLFIQFWFKSEDSGVSFLKISNKFNLLPVLGLICNNFQMLKIDSENFTVENFEPQFLGLNNWHLVGMYFNILNNEVTVYLDKRKFGTAKLDLHNLQENYILRFENKNSPNGFQIDLLRFIKVKIFDYSVFSNSNYKSFLSENNYVKKQIDFDFVSERAIYDNLPNAKIKNIKFLKSNAPIFTRAPELNISLHTGSVEIFWLGGDYKNAEKYEVQRRIGKGEFQTVYSVPADTSIEKSYSYLDVVENLSSGILFYRIKQINHDKSEVYTSSAKIGTEKIKPFTVKQNFPNPFNPNTSIEVELFEDTQLQIIVYNLEGKEISVLFQGFASRGLHKYSFDGSQLSSGIYLYKVLTPEFSETKKMILTK